MDYFRLNIGHVIVLNSIFMQVFAGIRKTVVNITSLCGIEPIASMGLYCTGKAAREMFFKVTSRKTIGLSPLKRDLKSDFFPLYSPQVLAKEEPETRVLNYAPGPVATSMLDQVVRQTWNAEIKSGTTALTTDETCTRLIQVLAQDKYTSGAHLDYFDPPLE